ncbi:ESX-1 secretion-associated protein [Mycobacterium sp. MBM]|nr:ESX-1 secretion-associated protein [Mycobacterium sp. MBM]
MGVLDAFMSTWSNARATFGAGSLQDGAAFDGGTTLDRLAEQVGTAAPAGRWTGTSADAYATVNAEHARVLAALGELDRRLREQVDESARLVSSGRASLEATRRWVADAAASVPPGAAADRLLIPIVARGVAEVIDTVRRSNSDLNAVGARVAALGEQYRALGVQKLAGPAGTPAPPPENPYVTALRTAGLLDSTPTGYYRDWLENAERQGVPPATVVDIARRHNITAASFDVLGGMPRLRDPDGKSFFALPKHTSGGDARKAVLMTYILNAGTGYGDNPSADFAPEPYTAEEVQRIVDRQHANAWTYDKDVRFILRADGGLVTTPNAMLMGMGGNWLQDQFSWKGGTAWGDIFMENIDHGNDPTRQLQQIVESGKSWHVGADGVPRAGSLDLDRLLHHEEMHSRQWADKGYLGMLWAAVTDSAGIEREAGLGDGGYR